MPKIDATRVPGGLPSQLDPARFQATSARDTGIRFRSGNTNLGKRLLQKLRGAGKNKKAPFSRLTVKLPSKKHRFTNNLMGVRDQVFGDSTDRRAVVSFHQRQLRDGVFRRQADNTVDPRLNTELKVDLGKGSHLSGFSASANPASAELDTSRPVVLFLSGSGGPAEQYGGELAKHFSEQKGVNFVALNYRGFGDSSDVAPTETTITKDGFAMINHLLEQGFKPEDIIVHGYSMGALVAARIQARVEADGYRLAGAVYDRPMSSATGVAESLAAPDQPPVSRSERVSAFVKKKLYAFGARITVGSMSTRKSLERLKQANPEGGFRSPTFVAYDNGSNTGGDELSRRMGEALGVTTLATGGDHTDHEMAIRGAFKSDAMKDLYATRQEKDFRLWAEPSRTDLDASKRILKDSILGEEHSASEVLARLSGGDKGIRRGVTAIANLKNIKPHHLSPRILNGTRAQWQTQTERIVRMAEQVEQATFNKDLTGGYRQYGTTNNPFKDVAENHPELDHAVREWLADGIDLADRLLTAQLGAVDGKPPLTETEMEQLQRDIDAFANPGGRSPLFAAGVSLQDEIEAGISS